MSLGEAHKLAPDAVFLAADPPACRAAFERALDALAAFSPSVEGESDPAADGFGTALLGIEGLERLWGGERRLVERIAAALAPLLPGPPRAGIAGTRFGAAVAAVTARGELPFCHVPFRAVPEGTEAEAAFLAPLPIALLPADGETCSRFALFGLRRIGDLARLPRSAVVARFGERGGFLHDLARGLDGRPLVPCRPPERLAAGIALEPPAGTLEPLRFVVRRLLGALCAQLAARGMAATTVRLRLVGESGERSEGSAMAIVLPEPSADAEAIERLVVARLEAARPSAPVERLELELDGVAPAAGQQLALFAPQAARAAGLEWQLARLALRFGPGRIRTARLRDPDARFAEDRFDWLDAG